MLKSLDGAAVRRWAAICCDELAAHCDEIDGLNVFPVPDQDTGSNLLATMRAGLDAVLRAEQDTPVQSTPVQSTPVQSTPVQSTPVQSSPADMAAAATAAVLARGALIGARGNSGVILSQVLRGIAESLAEMPQMGGAALREGLARAAELATAAVSEPATGTVLTVLQAAAQAAATVRSDDLCEVASSAAGAAACALADTPRQLAVLARAGVVDAGGQGLVLLLEALLAVITERHPQPVAVTVGARPARVLKVQREDGSAEFGYEVMYLLDETEEADIVALRAELAELGDCVAIVGSGSALGDATATVWNVHVHCSDVGAAIEAGVRAGRPHRITVLRFADQDGPARIGPDRGVCRAVLALVGGAGIAELLRAEGVATVPADCTVPELIAALGDLGAAHVTLLAGPGRATEMAECAATKVRELDQEVVIVPTASPVQTLAAIAVHDAEQRVTDDIVAMTEAAAATRRGELTVATQDALTWAGRCRTGDLLGMVDDEVVLIGRNLPVAACGLVDRMLSTGGELVTVLLGRQARQDVADVLAEHLRSHYPEVEVAVYRGDQPDSVLLIGVE